MGEISETKHLKTDDLNPPKTPKRFRVYSMKFCPFAERVRLTLNFKNIEYETVNINLRMKPEWFLELNPKGSVPVLDTGSKIMSESLDICNFLDHQFPTPPLWNPETKKADNEIIRSLDHLCSLFFDAAWKRNMKNLKENLESMHEDLQKLDAELEKRGGPFFGGKSLNMVDIAIWPFAERHEILPLVHKEPFEPEIKQKYPHICKWIDAMKNVEPIKRAIITPDRHYQASLFHVPGNIAKYDEI